MAQAGKQTKWRIGIALVLLLTAYGALHRFEYSRVYHPTKRVVPWQGGPGSTRQEIYFSTSDGVKLNGWYFAAATNSPRKQMAVLVCHGNGGNMGYLRGIYGRLAETGVNVLLFDYRGYGNSDGQPGEEGTYVDGQAAYAWLRQKGFAATNIIIYGQSLGGGIASELVLREPAGGLVLESTFTSTPDVGAVLFPWLPVHVLSAIKYDTHSKLSRVKIPVLIMHSHEDRLIPFQLAENNFSVANEPKLFWEITGGHATAKEECHLGMEKFLSALETARREGREVRF